MIYIVIPLFNRLKETQNFVSCLERQTFSDWSVIFIDDGSTDTTPKYLASLNRDRFRVIRGNGNWWWTRSINEGIRSALSIAKKTDSILTSNNDVTFSETYLATLDELQRIHPKTIISSTCETLTSNGSRYHCGYKVNGSIGGLQAIKYSELLETITVDTVSARGTLASIDFYKTVGLFDQRWLPHYGADIELFYRAFNFKFSILVSTKAKLIHHDDNSFRTVQTSTLRDEIKKLFDRRSPENLRTSIIIVIRFSNTFMLAIKNAAHLLFSNLRRIFLKVLN